MTALVLGMLFGGGLCLVYVGWRPRPEPLELALARFDQHPAVGGNDPPVASWDVRLGARMLRLLPPLARAVHKTTNDLRIAGRSPEEQAARTAVYGVFGLFLGPWYSLVVELAGAGSLPVIAGTLSLAGCGFGVVAPWASIRSMAARRRRDFLLALAAWCDMVAMGLAAGRGIEQAVTTAAGGGEGWAFGQLRGALSAGHVRGLTPWASLEALGEELGIGDLRELASTITMAGEDGAAIRTAVATKAHTIRERVTSETERAAERATAEMGMPTFAVAFGFLVFLGYPALVALSQSGF